MAVTLSGKSFHRRANLSEGWRRGGAAMLTASLPLTATLPATKSTITTTKTRTTVATTTTTATESGSHVGVLALTASLPGRLPA